MSQNDYSTLSDDRLLELFIDDAKRLGFVTNRNEGLRWLKGSRETKPVVDNEARRPLAEQTRDVANALRARKSMAAVERLLENDDPDVRAVASIAFADLAPELSYAAVQAVYAGLSTDHVAELQRRARQKPPERPTLAEMSDDELVVRFKDADERESGTHFLDYLDDPADKDLQNEIVREVWDVMRQLKARGLLARLLPLLSSDDLTVRREAATACLRVAAPQAEAALDSVARDGDLPRQLSCPRGARQMARQRTDRLRRVRGGSPPPNSRFKADPGARPVRLIGQGGRAKRARGANHWVPIRMGCGLGHAKVT